MEPPGISRADGKRPDGLTLVPWERGKSLVWDATVPDCLAPSYRATAVSGEAGLVAGLAESKKFNKYSNLVDSYIFTPIAIETLGAIGHRSKSFLYSLGRSIQLYSGEKNAIIFI